jgi:hypothetical protein
MQRCLALLQKAQGDPEVLEGSLAARRLAPFAWLTRECSFAMPNSEVAIGEMRPLVCGVEVVSLILASCNQLAVYRVRSRVFETQALEISRGGWPSAGRGPRPGVPGSIPPAG